MTHELMLYLQDLRESLPDIFTASALIISSPVVYLAIPFAIAAVLYLCVDKRKGEWVMLNISSAAFIGHFLKDVFCNPRPWLTDERIHPVEDALKTAESYSTPSGHATESTAGYGSLAILIRKRWFAITLIALILMIMFSRLFLGVHTLLDVVSGAILAIAVMTINWCLLRISYSNEHNYDAVSVILILVFIISSLIWYLISDSTMYLMRYGGLMLGIIVGRHLEHHLLNFEVKRTTFCRNTLRCLVGLIVAGSCFILPYLVLGSDLGSCIGGFLGAMGLLLFTPVLLESFGLNN